MLIMKLYQSKVTSLTTPSVFVFAVAIALAVFWRGLGVQGIMVVTAGYAAVLVVFVGAGGGG